MFTLFDMIRSSLNYVNLSTVLKNRIYTILAGIGNFYLLYVAFRFFKNGFWGRGTLFILAFLVILYFTYLNLLYYFTKSKKSKYDISPWIEKVLHIQSKDPMTAAEEERREMAPGYVQTNGIFKDEDFLPATVIHTAEQRDNIQQIAAELIRMDYMKADYQGLTEEEIAEKIKTTGKPVPALSAPVALPYFELAQKGNSLVVYGGLNQIDRMEVATVKEVGLLTAREAVKRYQLYLATAVITGGPEKINGRTGLIEKPTPYGVQVQVAYRERNTEKPSLSRETVQRSGNQRQTTNETTSEEHLTRSQHATFDEFGPRSRATQTEEKHWRSQKYKH